jgi:hypothetical protein
MARIDLSGRQIPTLSKLNIDGELTLDAQAGSEFQVLTSAGPGNTPTWSPTINGLSAGWTNGTTSGPMYTVGLLDTSGTTRSSVGGTIPIASAIQSGVVTTDTQTFAGNKTFTGDISTINNTIKFPDVGTSGFVKLGSEGILSASLPGIEDVFGLQTALDVKVDESYQQVTTGWLTAGTGFGSVSGTYTEKNGVVMVNLRATRTGATIAAGNITNTNVMTIAAGYRPLVEAAAISGPSGPLASCYIATTGGVAISALGTALSTGDNLDINATYIKA